MSRAKMMLAHWGMEGAALDPPIIRENVVHRVKEGGAAYALRLHRPGYRGAEALRSELTWMAMLAQAGVSVPAPLPTRQGGWLAADADGLASLLTWLPGAPMGAAGAPLTLSNAQEAFARLGEEMATLHLISDAWAPPKGFVRPEWSLAGLIGPAPLWGRFWDAPFLSAEDRDVMRDMRLAATTDLKALRGQDFGLIHADLLRENVLIDGGAVRLIDFDDSGWGWRAFDIATTLLKIRREPGYETLKEALIKGYRAHRPIDLGQLPLFLALRAATYLGWIAARMDEPGMTARIARNRDDAHWAATQYLNNR